MPLVDEETRYVASTRSSVLRDLVYQGVIVILEDSCLRFTLYLNRKHEPCRRKNGI